MSDNKGASSSTTVNSGISAANSSAAASSSSALSSSSSRPARTKKVPTKYEPDESQTQPEKQRKRKDSYDKPKKVKKSKSTKEGNDDKADKPGKAGKGGRKGKKKDGRPKRGKSAFIFFASEIRSKLIIQNPNMDFAEVARELGRMWQTLKKTDRKKYEDMAVKDKKRYDKEKAVFDAKPKDTTAELDIELDGEGRGPVVNAQTNNITDQPKDTTRP